MLEQLAVIGFASRFDNIRVDDRFNKSMHSAEDATVMQFGFGIQK